MPQGFGIQQNPSYSSTQDSSKTRAQDSFDMYINYPQHIDDSDAHSMPSPSTPEYGHREYDTESLRTELSSSAPSSIEPSSAEPSSTEPSSEETEEYLRRTLAIPPHMPLNLSSLPDEPLGTKSPKISDLIKLAIWASPDHKLTLRQIYNAIEERYPSYRKASDKPWQVHHALYVVEHLPYNVSAIHTA